jgi:hypothetical protein
LVIGLLVIGYWDSMLSGKIFYRRKVKIDSAPAPEVAE